MEILLATIQPLFVAIAAFGWPVILVENIMNNKECANTLFHTNFLDPDCLRLAISKALGYVTIAGACLYKLPVVMNIFRSKSGSGLHPISVYLESSSFISMFYYNFQKGNDFSTYGDNISATIQNMMIVLMIWFYGIDGKALGAGHISITALVFAIFGTGLFFCPAEYLGSVAIYATVISTISKLPQIWQNFTTKNIGVQSWVTQLTSFLGVVAKLFICITETGDDIYLVIGTVTAVVLNGMLLLQSVLYASDNKKKKD